MRFALSPCFWEAWGIDGCIWNVYLKRHACGGSAGLGHNDTRHGFGKWGHTSLFCPQRAAGVKGAAKTGPAGRLVKRSAAFFARPPFGKNSPALNGGKLVYRMIEAHSLFFSYPDAASASLRGISFTIPTGSLACFAGANGSGKSTLLCLLAGLFVPTPGPGQKKLVSPPLRVGEALSPGDEKLMRKQAALVLQDPERHILGATVSEDLYLGLPPDDGTPGCARRRACEAARRLGLEGNMDSFVDELSYGQKRKLCLATALARSPRLLLLDEPFSGLDYPAILEMRRILVANREAGITQIIATHDLEPLADIADYLVLLQKGTLACQGRPCELMDRAAECGLRPPCSWRKSHTLDPWS